MTRERFPVLCVLATCGAAYAQIAPTVFDGLQIEPLGGAVLSTDPATGQLVVSNIGSSGQDGVLATYPSAAGVEQEWNDYNIHDPGVTLSVDYEVFLNGLDTVVGGWTIDQSLGQPTFIADFSGLTSAGNRINCYTDGQIQGSVLLPSTEPVMITGLGGAPTARVTGWGTTHATQEIAFVRFDRQGEPGPAAEVRFFDGRFLTADELRVAPVNPPVAPGGVTKVFSSFGGKTEERADEFATRVSERLRHKGRAITLFDYERLTLESFPSVYKVRCINHTQGGECGLRTEPLEQVQPSQIKVVTTPSAPLAVGEGQRATLAPEGKADSPAGQTEGELGTLDIQGEASGVRITPDFTPLGPTMLRFSAHLGGDLVSSVDAPISFPLPDVFLTPAPPAPFVPIPYPNIGFKKGDPDKGESPGQGAFWVRTDSPLDVLLPGAPAPVLADSLTVSTVDAQTIDIEIIALNLTTTGIAEFDVDVHASRQSPKNDFGTTIKAGAGKGLDAPPGLDVFAPLISTSGQTEKVVVRGWNPTKKEEIVGEAVVPGGVVVDTEIDMIAGERVEVRATASGDVAMEELTLAHEALDALSVELWNDFTIAAPPIQIVELLCFCGDTLARAVGTDLRGRLAVVNGLPNADVTTRIENRPKPGAGSIVIGQWDFDSPVSATLFDGSTATADAVRVTYVSEFQPLFPFTRAFVGHSGSGDMTITNMAPVHQTREHILLGRQVGVPAGAICSPCTLPMGTAGLSRYSPDDGVLVRFPESSTPGFFFRPEIDDEVVVEFEPGDPVHPFVLGSLWNGKGQAPDGSTIGDITAEADGAGGMTVSSSLPFAVPDHTVRVFDNGVETGSYIVFGDGMHGRRPPTAPPPGATGPDGIVQLSMTSHAADPDGVARVKVKFPWTGPVESPDATTVLLGDEMLIEARKSANESSAIGTLRMTGQFLPGYTITRSSTGFVRCNADLTTGNTNPGDPLYGVPDGAADGADLSYYVEQWLNAQIGCAPCVLIADMTTTSTNPGDALYGVPDGTANGADLSFYVELWLGGCP